MLIKPKQRIETEQDMRDTNAAGIIMLIHNTRTRVRPAICDTDRHNHAAEWWRTKTADAIRRFRSLVVPIKCICVHMSATLEIHHKNQLRHSSFSTIIMQTSVARPSRLGNLTPVWFACTHICRTRTYKVVEGCDCMENIRSLPYALTASA